MNDEIKRAAEKDIDRVLWEDYRSRGKESFSGSVELAHRDGFISGANYANEKCQEEIKRLKDAAEALIDISDECYMGNNFGLINTVYKYKGMVEEIKKSNQYSNNKEEK